MSKMDQSEKHTKKDKKKKKSGSDHHHPSVRLTIDKLSQVPDPPNLMGTLMCCSICQKCPPPGSYSCDEGHLTCPECFSFSTPQRCGSKIDVELELVCYLPLKKSPPCYLHKMLYNRSKFLCPTAPLCTKTVTGDKLQDHEERCLGLVKIQCWLSHTHIEEGQELFSIETLLEHLVSAHNAKLYKNCGGMIAHKYEANFGLEGSKGVAIPFVMSQEDGFYFCCVCFKRKIGKEDIMFLVVYYTHVDLHKSYHNIGFVARIEFIAIDEENKIKPRIWLGALPDISMSINEVVQGMSCLIVPIDKEARSGYVRLIIENEFSINTHRVT